MDMGSDEFFVRAKVNRDASQSGKFRVSFSGEVAEGPVPMGMLGARWTPRRETISEIINRLSPLALQTEDTSVLTGDPTRGLPLPAAWGKNRVFPLDPVLLVFSPGDRADGIALKIDELYPPGLTGFAFVWSTLGRDHQGEWRFAGKAEEVMFQP
jgi:hypothetical protein